eukprot:1516612-Ditylum_brightwellii.AAC.1
MPEKQSAACRSHSEREGKCKAKCKAGKKDSSQHQYCKYHGSCNHTTDECNITIACCKSCICHELKEGSHKSKRVHFCRNRAKLCEFLANKSKDLNMIINKKIDKAFRCQEKKKKADLN